MRVISTRLAHLLGVLLGVSFLVFLLMELMPGDTAEILGGQLENPTPEAIEQIRLSMGLDQPFIARYFDWIWGAVRGDLGESYRTGQTVMEAIGNHLGVTLQLLVMVEILSLSIAVPLAALAASKRDSWIDKVVAFFTFGLQAMPNFMVAVLLVYFFSVQFQVLPAIGFVPLSEGVGASLRSLVIPTVALSASLIPVYIRVLRTEMVRTLQEDYILLARAVGLGRLTILVRYALRPSLPTLVTIVGVNVGVLLGGAIVIEQISGLPGIGTLLFSSITSQDYLMVQGVILLVAAAYVVTNFVVDLMYTWLDPRVRL